MASHAIIYWITKDGKLLPFTHPDTLAERLESVERLKNTPEFLTKAEAEWSKIFKPKVKP